MGRVVSSDFDRMVCFFEFLGFGADQLWAALSEVKRDGKTPIKIVIPAVQVFGVPVEFGCVESARVIVKE